MDFFSFFFQENSQKKSPTVIESWNLSNLQNLDEDSQIYLFEWILHNGWRKTHIEYQSDIRKIELLGYLINGNKWKNIQSLQLQREEYEKLLNQFP